MVQVGITMAYSYKVLAEHVICGFGDGEGYCQLWTDVSNYVDWINGVIQRYTD